MKKILFIVDKEGWAYDDAAKNWRSLLKNEYECDILYLNKYQPLSYHHKFNLILKKYQSEILNNSKVNFKDLLNESNLFVYKNKSEVSPLFDHKNYDGIYIFYHRALCDSRLLATAIPMEKIAVAINNEKWVETGALEEFAIYLDGPKIIAGCNKFIINSFSSYKDKIYRVSQTINDKVFFEKRSKFLNGRVGSDMIIGWSGDFENPLKNFQLILESCKKTSVCLSKQKTLSREDLNIWYNSIDSVICASSSEGGPLLILEAGAVGLPVITTSVGLAREIIIDNETGLKVENNINSITKNIKKLQNNLELRRHIARKLQKEVLKNWTYTSRIDEILILLKNLTNQ